MLYSLAQHSTALSKDSFATTFYVDNEVVA